MQNTAVGFLALKTDTTGSYNTAIGSGTLRCKQFRWKYRYRHIRNVKQYHWPIEYGQWSARPLQQHQSAICNTAVGYSALFSNIRGLSNTAFGFLALYSNTGNSNTAIGVSCARTHTTGDVNTAIGAYALQRIDATGGNNNVALGYFAGGNVVNCINDIFIGNIGPLGLNTDQNTIRIGTQVTATDFHGFTHNPHVATYIAGISEAGVSGAPVLVSADGHWALLYPQSDSRRLSNR